MALTVLFELPATPPAPAPELPRHISAGAFFDRFGALKWSILADTSPSVQALIKDCTVRKYIDLDNPALPYGLDMLIASGHSIDKTAILTGEVLASERP